MKNKFLNWLISIVIVMLISGRDVSAQDYCKPPPFTSAPAPPVVMLVMGRSHKLYYEAYNDASDIDEDGVLDVGYKHSINYYGYFDPYKCYKYEGSGSNAKFVPIRTTSDKYCGGEGEWSGNFLNWLSMSRMDVLRKVLYGGYRSTDSASETVLEGVYIPQDAHSWGKEYFGDDTRELTPFDPPQGTCVLPESPVTWNKDGKILFVIYDDSKEGVYGNNHQDLISSFSPCDYKEYAYLTELDTTNDYNNRNRIDTGNYLLVAEFMVTQEGQWQFAIDSDDGSEVEIDGTVVASYYSGHWFCGCSSCGCSVCQTCQDAHSGGIYLTQGWHRIIVRLRENYGDDGVLVWYKKPGNTDWKKFSASTLTIRAPDIDNTCRLKSQDFILSGEPGSGGGILECKRHLFCVTSLGDGQPHIIRVLLNKSNRVWEWASKERPVCDNSLGTPDHEYFVRVKVCDPSVGLESNCKEYPAGTYKPTGLLQKYGEGDGSKVCSKSLRPCNTDSDCGSGDGLCIDNASIFFGLISGSYTNNLKGGVLRKNMWSFTDEINSQTGIFKSSENIPGNIVLTLDRMKTVGFRYSDNSYQGTYSCGWITTRGIDNGECRMWGNPIGEMLYETLRFFAGKENPTSDYTYSQNQDTGLNLPKPDWGIKYGSNRYFPPDLFPSCSRYSVIVISDVNPNYDSDNYPNDLNGLNLQSLTKEIGDGEGITGKDYFIGESGSVKDFVCTEKEITDLGDVKGLCPEEPTKEGTYYSSAIAYYGHTYFKDYETNGKQVDFYSIALSSPVPDIKIKVGDNIVTLVPVGKSVSGCLSVYNACAAKSDLSYDPDRGLIITNTQSDAYCPSNQIVDFYVTEIGTDSGKFSINYEDVEQGADHDMDAIVTYEYEVIDNSHVKIKLSSTYAAGCIDQVMGFVISGTTQDGLYLPVRDKDSEECDGDTPNVVCNMPLTWEHTFTVSDTPTATLIKNPLWFVAKWGGFEDLNNNDKPDLTAEWDKDSDGVPDNYFFVANPLKLYEQLDKAFKAVLSRSGSAGAVATVPQKVLREDIVIRGAFENNPEQNEAWKGHLETYWPYGPEDVSSQSDCEAAGWTWSGGECTGSGVKYDFDVHPDITFCKDMPNPRHCWDAGQRIQTHTDRTIFTYINNSKVYFNTSNATTLDPYLENDIDFNNDSSVDIQDTRALINWVRGDDTYEGSTARDRDGWVLGDIVYSTPIVVGTPSLGAVPEEAVGDCSCNCSADMENCAKQCFYCYRYKYMHRKKVIYVGANDGMLHAFLAGYWFEDPDPTTDNDGDGVADESHWIYNPNESNSECDGYSCTDEDGYDLRSQIGQELWAYIPSNLLSELKYLADPNYGRETGCQHRTMVDLSPEAWDVYIRVDTNNNGDLSDETPQWRTVLVGGERGGGDLYFALDITNPDNPRILWEYPVMRNMIQLHQGANPDVYNQSTPYLDQSVYEQVKILPVSWSKPYIGRLNIPESVCFYAADPIDTWQTGTPSLSVSCKGADDLSEWFVFIGGGVRIFDLNNLPSSLSGDEKKATLKPFFMVLDMETGTNIFQFIWPLLQAVSQSEWPDMTVSGNYIPYAMSDPLVLDIWDANGEVNKDGYSDHIYVGDLNGQLYGIKFHMGSGFSDYGLRIDVWRTKDGLDSNNHYRSEYQPITVTPVGAFGPNNELYIYFGTGKYDNVTGGNDDKSDTARMSFYNLKESCNVKPLSSTPCSVTKSGSTFTFSCKDKEVEVSGTDFTIEIDFHCSSTSFHSNCTWSREEGSLYIPDCCEDYCCTNIETEAACDSISACSWGNGECSGNCWHCVYDLTRDGERVTDSALVAGELVFFTTFVPNPESCQAGGDGYIYAMDYRCRPLSNNPFENTSLTYEEIVTGSENKVIGYRVHLNPDNPGEGGIPSKPVLDSTGEHVLVQDSTAKIHRIKVELPKNPFYLKGWKEEGS